MLLFKPKLKGLVLLYFLLFAWAIKGKAQSGPLRFSTFTIDNGLSDNLVYTIAQDKQGFMWFGTHDGLNRFDGYEFKAFRHDPFDTGSLSDNTVIALFADSRGSLWAGTAHGGLNRFNPETGTFTHFLSGNANELDGAYVESITEDKAGNLWVGTFGNGLFKFIFSKNGRRLIKTLHFAAAPDKNYGLWSNYILSVYADASGRLWVGFVDGTLQRASLTNAGIRFIKPRFTVCSTAKKISGDLVKFDISDCTVEPNKTNLSSGGQVTFFEDQKGLWMGRTDGLYLFRNKSDSLLRFDLSQPSAKQGSVLSICSAPQIQGKAGVLWMGTYYGVELFNTSAFTMQLVRHAPGDAESLAEGRILKVFKDRSGSIWLGSNGTGMSRYNFQSDLFPHPYYASADAARINKLSILSFFEDKQNLWLGTFSGFWKIDKKTNRLSGVLSNNSVKGAEPNDAWPELVHQIVPADSGNLWLASGNGLIRYQPRNNHYIIYPPNISILGRTDNVVIRIYDDHFGHLWLLTPQSLSRFDLATKRFEHYFYNRDLHNQTNELPKGAICPDKKGNFWVGTNRGLLFFDGHHHTFRRFVYNPDLPSSISSNRISCIVPDNSVLPKALWIGTSGGGLNYFDLKTEKFKHFGTENGLPNNVINGLLKDAQSNLWISTNKGISMFNPRNKVFLNYSTRQGLPSNEFNTGSFYQNSDGQFYFGSISGFTAFFPDRIKEGKYAPSIVFTDFRLFNNSVSLKDKQTPLKVSITETRILTLPYKDNIISFEVAALNVAHADQTEYAYRLENFSSRWILNGVNRLITFSNLNPGHYILQVKASNGNGLWGAQTAELHITILPPWWKTWWAYMLYILAAASLLFYSRQFELKRIQLRNKLAGQQLEAQKLKDLDHFKSLFFNNISHEFRSPLTLIMGVLEDFKQDGDVKKMTQLAPEMYHNSKRLLQLINQLLDLARLDAGKYTVNAGCEDIIPFVCQTVHAFSSLAERRKITLETIVDPNLTAALVNHKFCFDEDIMEKILTNLISNAFKFTPKGGSILVSLHLHEAPFKSVELQIKDTGEGISSEHLSHIFNRFYQGGNYTKTKQGGSGIGLSLVKELVTLHKGTITVSSALGKGALFTCLFPLDLKWTTPITKVSLKTDQPETNDWKTAQDQTETAQDLKTEDKPLVLIIEDQQDLRKYLLGKLRGQYSVMEAGDGKTGLELAFKEIPDLVISDVMMPEMDGFAVCRHLKTDKRTSHIPVILLTARADDQDKLTGLETGADVYLIKPFNAKELAIQVKNLILVRNRMRTKFSDKLVVKPSEVAVTSLDQTFMQDLLKEVEKEIANSGFGVEQLAARMNMSSSQLYRKLKALINQSPQQFIRSLRMQRAYELLKNHSGTVSEICWKVGFEDPGYFSKTFKKHFGFLPSEKDRLH